MDLRRSNVFLSTALVAMLAIALASVSSACPTAAHGVSDNARRTALIELESESVGLLCTTDASESDDASGVGLPPLRESHELFAPIFRIVIATAARPGGRSRLLPQSRGPPAGR